MCKGALSLARQTLDVLRQTSGAVPRCGPTNSSHSASPNPTLLPLDSARPRAPLAASAPAPFWEAPPGSRARPLRGPLCPGLEGHGSGRQRHSFPAQTPRQGHRAVRHPAALANLGAERPSRRGMSPRSTRGHRFRPGVPSPSPGRSDSFPSLASGDRCTHSSSCLLVKTLLLIKSRFRRVCTQGRERGVTGSRGVCPAVSGPPSGLVGQQTHSAPRGLSDIESPAPVPLLFLTRLLAGVTLPTHGIGDSFLAWTPGHAAHEVPVRVFGLFSARLLLPFLKDSACGVSRPRADTRCKIGRRGAPPSGNGPSGEPGLDFRAVQLVRFSPLQMVLFASCLKRLSRP